MHPINISRDPENLLKSLTRNTINIIVIGTDTPRGLFIPALQPMLSARDEHMACYHSALTLPHSDPGPASPRLSQDCLLTFPPV